MNDPKTRFAIVYSDNPSIANYLPKHYRVTHVVGGKTYISGHDYRGWTLDDYVIPRLGSGLFSCEEIVDS